MSETLNVLAAVIGLIAAVIPVLHAMGGLPLVTPRRKLDYALARQLDADLQDAAMSEASKWRGYRLLLRGSRADLGGAEVVRSLPDAEAMDDYIASDELLVFRKESGWFEFVARYSTSARRAVWRAAFFGLYLGCYTAAFWPHFAYEMGWATPRAPMTSVFLLSAGMLCLSAASLLTRRRLTRTEAFLKRIEQYRPLSKRTASAFEAVPLGMEAGNDTLMECDAKADGGVCKAEDAAQKGT